MALTQTQTNPLATRGTLLEKHDGFIVLGVPGTDYRLHLLVTDPVAAAVGDLIEGCILAQAMRVDVITAGGRYIEPVFGRPRRIQGRIVGGCVADNTIVVDCGAKVHCTLLDPQRAADFSTQQMVSFDVRPGALFEAACSTCQG